MNKLQDVLKRLREKYGENQGQLAKRVEVTQPTMSAWENGHDTPSAAIYVRLGNLADYPDCMWVWQQAGLSERAMLMAAEKKLKESGVAIVAAETIRIPCVEKSADGTKPLDRTFPFPAKFAPNPLSTICLIVGESASNASIPAGDHIVLDESGRDAHSLTMYLNRVILLESFAPVRGSLKNGTFATAFSRLVMGRLRFKSCPIAPDGTGIFSICWKAVLDAPEDLFTWRPGDPGTPIGQWAYIPGKLPMSEKDDEMFQECARSGALREMRPYDAFKILGEVVCWFKAPSVVSR